MLLFEHLPDRPVNEGLTLLQTLKKVYRQVDEFVHDRKIAQLVKMVQESGNLSELTIPELKNTWLKSCFELHKKQLMNVAIFKELLKSLVSCFAAK